MKEIPKFLAHLPVYRGYPVPYFVPLDENGNFNFKYASWEKISKCADYHRCCVCFKPLIKKDYWFISGPMGIVNQVDSHSPMHKECAEHSMKICPHLYFEKTKRTTDYSQAQDHQIMEKPKKLFLVGAKKFKKVIGHTMFKYNSVFYADEYVYEDGILTKTDNI